MGAPVLVLYGHADTDVPFQYDVTVGFEHYADTLMTSFSPDGTRIVMRSGQKAAKVWDARTGAPAFELNGHTDVVLDAKFSPDGTRIVTGSRDKTAKVWDAQDGAPVLSSMAPRTGCGARRSARTARGSSPEVMTRRQRCGTRGRGRLYSSSTVTQGWYLARRSSRTARGSSPQVSTGRRKYGTRRRMRPSSN